VVVFDPLRGPLVDLLRRRYLGTATGLIPCALAAGLRRGMRFTERLLVRTGALRPAADDILDLRSRLSERFRGSGAVIHLAGRAHPQVAGATESDYRRINYEGSVNVFEAARAAGVPKFIFASSGQVYGINRPVRIDQFPILETNYCPTLAEGQNLYGFLKREFERYLERECRGQGIQAVSLRLEFPGVRSRFPWNLYISTSVENTIAGFMAALNADLNGAFEVFNLADRLVDERIVNIQDFLRKHWPDVPNRTKGNECLLSTGKNLLRAGLRPKARRDLLFPPGDVVSERDYPWVILGAGLCGLSAAYHLEEDGKTDYVVLEQGHAAGGLARTVTQDGFAFDHAIHVLYSRDPYASELICNRLLKGNARQQIRQSYCYTAGVYTEYPYQMNNYGLPPAVIAANILGLIEAHYGVSRNGPPAHFEAWIYETFGRGIAEHFMIPYNRRQWAWNLREMSHEWIADRVPVPEIREVLLGALRPAEKKHGPNRQFWYPVEGGIEALPRAFVRHIPPERLWLQVGVAGVDGIRREVLLAHGRRLRYGRLISSIPLPRLVQLLGEAVPPRIRECAAGLKCNRVHTVNVGLEGAELCPRESMHWIYFPEEGTIFHRVSFPCSFSPWMAPRGCSSIQVEISESAYRPHPRAALIQQALEHLVAVGILKPREARPVSAGGRVRASELITLDPAYIIYDLSHRANTQATLEYLTGLNICSKGRFGEWEYLNMDQVILGGKAAVEETAGWH